MVNNRKKQQNSYCFVQLPTYTVMNVIKKWQIETFSIGYFTVYDMEH